MGAFGTWSFRARAELGAATLRLGHITDAEAGGKKAALERRGWLGEYAEAISDDLEKQLKGAGLDLIVRGDGGAGYEFIESGGLRLARLAVDGGGRLMDGASQLAALSNDLAKSPSVPTVLALHPCLVAGLTRPDAAMPAADREAVVAIIKENPQVALVLCGKALANRAAFIEGTRALCLVTCSPLLYPCGARMVEIEVKDGGAVTIRSWFIQTRLLNLVEDGFYKAGPGALKNLGSREDRTFTAIPGAHEIKKNMHALPPGLAPEWSGKDGVALAVVSDTHLCLDRFVSPDHDSDYRLIGHFMEAGSKAILDDVLDQIKDGRHRVEFYDAAFLKDPEAESNFLPLPVDHLLFCGDMFEHGKKEEAEEFRARLNALPAPLHDHAAVTIGNHDMFQPDFAPDGPASSRRIIADFFSDYLPQKGETNYVVHLNDWATLIVLDTTIARHSNQGLGQDRIDWLDDVLAELHGRVVLMASHHPIFPLTLVPPAMDAYLRARSHFTPKRSASRVLLQEVLARHNNVKMVISGHYHGVVVDQYKKLKPGGDAADDAFTTHVQVPCTVEYPNGYRLFKLSRAGSRATIEYISAYTRKAELRDQSREAPIFKYMGTEARVPHNYQGTLERLNQQDAILGHAAMLDPYDLIDLNVRGFKDGTARAGKGNTGKPNINGKVEVTI